jgi:hypothetical protein
MTTTTVTPPSLKALKQFNPLYSRWRHGGWYVHGVRYPSGACGCVSRNYPDKKWRIVCDDRRTDLGQPGDFTYPSRDAAAFAEYELAVTAHQAARTLPVTEATPAQQTYAW